MLKFWMQLSSFSFLHSRQLNHGSSAETCAMLSICSGKVTTSMRHSGQHFVYTAALQRQLKVIKEVVSWVKIFVIVVDFSSCISVTLMCLCDLQLLSNFDLRLLLLVHLVVYAETICCKLCNFWDWTGCGGVHGLCCCIWLILSA